jgi:outer membrane beta-barrel protein
MKHFTSKQLFGALAFASAALLAAPVQAQEIQLRGPLAGARSVSRLVRYREGRIALTPTFGISIQDEFSRDLFFGVRADYHITDWLGIGVMGAVAPVHVNTSLTDQITQRSPAGTGNVPVRTNFPQQVGRRNWMADVHVTFIPLRGKFALFQSLVADVDFFIFAGAAFVGVSERAGITLINDTVRGDLVGNDSMRLPSQASQIASGTGQSQIARASRVAIAPTFGAGLNFYINRFISINFEYRAMPFSWNASGTDENSTATRCGVAGNTSCAGFSDYSSTYFDRNPANRVTTISESDRTLHFNQMFSIGLSFYLPTSPNIAP